MKARMAVALLALTGFFIALYLTLYKVGVVGEMTCAVGSCERVQTSRYATLLGLPVAAWGLVAYAGLFALAMVRLHAPEGSRVVAWALVAFSGWCVLFSAYLTYLELFVIDAICQWCVVSAVIVTLIFVSSVIDLRGSSRGVEAADVM